ncbi:unnamed protein product [Rhizoctonia solani]|uniref:Lysine-specific metallo-endopeptidase domain-containing protein n=1 Tax=Rhizoctonia solani TaxID=456999 RepID=A0A8H3I4T2_9AGAM|nr:unnamed protein product [Rhizoctonia solani]
MVHQALDYLRRFKTDKIATDRFTPLFGQSTSKRLAFVRSHLRSAASKATSLTYDCIACKNNHPEAYWNVHAYVMPKQHNTINLCGFFWAAPRNRTEAQAEARAKSPGRISGAGRIQTKAGTIIREMLNLKTGMIKPKVLEQLKSQGEFMTILNSTKYMYLVEDVRAKRVNFAAQLTQEFDPEPVVEPGPGSVVESGSGSGVESLPRTKRPFWAIADSASDNKKSPAGKRPMGAPS